VVHEAEKEEEEEVTTEDEVLDSVIEIIKDFVQTSKYG